jgi:hypothetical protein
MFQSFAANHYLLTKGTPEQKVELAASLLNGYNIPLAELLNFISLMVGISELKSIPDHALKKELADIKGHFTAQAPISDLPSKKQSSARLKLSLLILLTRISMNLLRH